ncbi:hypothetical protein L2E82_06094 [Cichorium intybus]|uniref:Uncharacterized protein n=1 Tax=Cichorium intybus TaxID=13427 RepID=A0ACB9HAF3_CICIN|nr:hypothetical protein L2E82_06094 [Cichorium intybus]
MEEKDEASDLSTPSPHIRKVKSDEVSVTSAMTYMEESYVPKSMLFSPILVDGSIYSSSDEDNFGYYPCP